MRLIYWLLLSMCVAVVPAGGQQSSSSRQGTADLGMSGAGIRLGPGRNAASVSDDSYHNNAVPIASAFLAWIDVRNGYQHNSVSHAVAIIKRLGYETGAYDTFIRSDSNMITKRTVKGSDGTPLLYGKIWGTPEGTVIVTDQKFPGVSQFGPTFNIRDEFYQSKNFSPEKSRVLMRWTPQNSIATAAAA